MCVDASADILFICKTLLEALGFAVLTAETADSALAMAGLYTISAIVLENDLPGNDGSCLAEKLKAIQDVPVLMFSGSRPQACTSVDAFVNKSAGPRAMSTTLTQLLARASVSPAST